MTMTSQSFTRTDDDHALRGTGYRVLRRIGWGATTEVLEAVDASGAPVAVKILRRAVSGEGATRLVHEATALAAIDHPHVVPLLDAAVTPTGRPFFVMPLLHGESLRDRLRHAGSIAPERACELVAGVLDGLEVAHAQGIVHRDVKPGNVFLASDAGARASRERAVLLDFGIAKLEGVTLDCTTGAHVIGTPRYLAPEQILGGSVDARTDVYAAGLVLFEAIAGRSPFTARDPFELMRAHLELDPTPLRTLARASRALEAVVERALQKRPDRRFATAGAFAEALREAAPARRSTRVAKGELACGAAS